MEFDIQRQVFLDGVQKTLGIVERKSTMPILGNLLLKTEDNQIKIVATDRELGLVADYEAQIISSGAITLSAKKLFEMIREIQGDSIHFSCDDHDQITLSSQKAVYRIPGISADEFPAVAYDENLPLYPVPASLLKELISKISFAISNDETRKNLTGALMEAEPGEQGTILRMVATDGHRLARSYEVIEGNSPFTLEKGIILPRKGISEIRKLIDAEQGEILIGSERGMFVLKTANTLLKVSLIDETYPDYTRVIPSQQGVRVIFNHDLLLHGLRRMKVISTEQYSGVVLTLNNNRMIMNSTNPDVGEANDELEVAYQGEEVKVGFNVDYLIDAIEVIREEEVLFDIGSFMKPSMIMPVHNDRFLCVVMPLKL
ncbi:DNA polymerase III subunit beta [Syntrophus aciditrophicus]|uniref:Beta sliding clamp n=1 Tax=Syntrophus aciditrophicus (strain SB) TaxID=56780 RepID=Q2LYA2_SYNAS|nr:DNA polymerase III subunit beta [Syntrophus aciditrophicus]ABC75881.1 DNA polymerase III, beta chain [Syntrophus aciditrophicus SB]OPY16396.1 MAG: DNA polymerase III subunit beta [Syntrophus sp. PtaB.Bin075]